jgi:hypothetical protein
MQINYNVDLIICLEKTLKNVFNKIGVESRYEEIILDLKIM